MVTQPTYINDDISTPKGSKCSKIFRFLFKNIIFMACMLIVFAISIPLFLTYGYTKCPTGSSKDKTYKCDCIDNNDTEECILFSINIPMVVTGYVLLITFVIYIVMLIYANWNSIKCRECDQYYVEAYQSVKSTNCSKKMFFTILIVIAFCAGVVMILVGTITCPSGSIMADESTPSYNPNNCKWGCMDRNTYECVNYNFSPWLVAIGSVLFVSSCCISAYAIYKGA
eukprot:355588_1